MKNIQSESSQDNRLRAERDHYFALFDLAPTGYLTISDEGLILEANLASATLLRESRRTLLKQPITRFIFSEDQDVYEHKRKLCFGSSASQVWEMRLVRSDGSLFWVNVQASPAPNGEYWVAVHNIAESKLAEEYEKIGREVLPILDEPGTLRDSFQHILNVLKKRTGFDAVGIRLQNGDDFPYFVQNGFAKDFLLTENSLIERTEDGGLCRNPDGTVSLECTCGLVLTGKTDPANSLFTPGGSFWTNDSFPLLAIPSGVDPRRHPRNECIHQGYASVALVPIRDKNRILGLIQFNDRRKGGFTLETVELMEGIAIHIGAAMMRKEAETALRESELNYRTLADSGQALIWKARPDKLCDYFNKVWLEFTGRTYEQEFGNGWAEGVHPDDFDRCLDIYVTSFDKREAFSMDYRLRRHDGEYRWLQDDGCPRYDIHGMFIGYIGYCLDVTERKVAERELKNKNTELERFTYTVSHDLKSPLITIQSYAGLILKDMEAGNHNRIQGDLKKIEGAAAKMTNLLNDLLELSRVGRVMNSPVPIDMNLLVSDTVMQLAGPIKQSKVAVVVQTQLPVLRGDRSRIAEVVQNLIENAIKYMGVEADPRIDIGVRYDGKEPVYFVRDNGTGIDPHFHETIFGLFNKLDSESEGTGIGLALVERIITVHGGRVWVESEGVGSGSCFCFSVPS